MRLDQISILSPQYSRRLQPFAALRYRNYRLWFVGQIISLFGTWMQSTALGFFVYELTHSPAYLGYVAFAAGVPTWLFMLMGGVAADRVPRRSVLVATQSGMMLLAFVLSVLTFTGAVHVYHILAIAFGVGIANAFDAPARQAFVSELVSREDMTNAIALNSSMFNLGTAVGPAAAGLVYAKLGPAWCFTINGVTFLAVLVALLRMKFELVQRSTTQRSSALREVRESFLYILREPLIRTLIAVVGMMSLFGLSFITLLPAWAVNVLHGDVTTNGWLGSARGVGALISALILASLGRFRYRGRLLLSGMFAFPVFLLLFVFARQLPLSLVLLGGVGASIILVMNLANALVQTRVSDSLRGRVMGVYSLTFFGILPLGGLLAGGLAERLSEPTAIMICAVVLLGLAIFTWIAVPKVRAQD
jgi:MFS family permease